MPKTVHISFPVEITPIQSVAVIGPGESAEIQWRVSNLSNRNFLGLGGALRTLRTALRRVGGDATATTIQGLRMEGNEQSDGSSFLRTITELKARESVIIAGHIDFSDQAQPYTFVDLQSSLGLEILGTRDFSTIMTHGHRITISQTYRYTPDAALVMLTNSRTTREEYNAWMKLYADLGLKADVWDMSYNRDLNLVRDLVDDQKGQSLIKNYQNKTIVLLNNEMSELNNQRSLRMLNHAQFFEAASSYNINFYVFGGDQDTLSSEMMGMHLSPNRLAPVVGNQDRFIKAIESNNLAGPMQLQDSDQMSYQELNSVLRQRPDSNYSLVYTESGRTPKLTLYPSLSMLQGRMIAQPASLRDSQASAFILSPKNVRPFVLSLGLEQKVKSYNYLAAAANVNYLPALTSSLIHDLIETSYYYKKTENSQTKSEQLAKLQKAFSELQRSNLPAASNEFMARVLAAYSFFASVSEDVELKKIADQILGSLDQNLKPVFDRTFESYKNFSEQRQRVLTASFEKDFDTYKMFTLPAIGRAVTNTNTMFIKPSQIIRAGQ